MYIKWSTLMLQWFLLAYNVYSSHSHRQSHNHSKSYSQSLTRNDDGRIQCSSSCSYTCCAGTATTTGGGCGGGGHHFDLVLSTEKRLVTYVYLLFALYTRRQKYMITS